MITTRIAKLESAAWAEASREAADYARFLEIDPARFFRLLDEHLPGWTWEWPRFRSILNGEFKTEMAQLVRARGERRAQEAHERQRWVNLGSLSSPGGAHPVQGEADEPAPLPAEVLAPGSTMTAEWAAAHQPERGSDIAARNRERHERYMRLATGGGRL